MRRGGTGLAEVGANLVLMQHVRLTTFSVLQLLTLMWRKELCTFLEGQ